MLDPDLALSDVVKVRESTIDVGDYLVPLLGVKARVALGYFTDNNPGVKLSDVFVHGICIDWLIWCLLEADGAHVVVVAVIDIGPVG